jgi:serine/threonine-protein kinase
MAHPTIVRVYDAGEEASIDSNGQERKTPYIVMEYVRGTLLRDLMHQRRIEIPEAIGYAEGVLTALEFSHRAGVIHRDIKSANIMVTDTGLVKVMDFGIARAISDSSATQAHTNGIVGTAQYFSPEQARGENVDARTDLYSTGVLLYEMLAGRPPFKGETAVSVAYQHVSEAVTPPSVHNPLISRELDEVVLRALAKNRDERFQSAEEFREHLLSASLDVPLPPVADGLEGLAAVEDQLPTTHTLTPEAAEVLSDLDEFEAIIAGAMSDDSAETLVAPVEEVETIAPVDTPAPVEVADVIDAPSATETSRPSSSAPSFDERTQIINETPKTNPFEQLGVTFEDTASGEVATKTKPANMGLIWGFGSGAVVFLIAMLAWLLSGSLPNIQPSDNRISVANVVNQNFDAASATLVGQNLLVQKQYEVSDTVPVDTVIRTDPSAGTMVGKNTLVVVYVSSGKTQVSMPDLKGMNEQMAKDAIDQAGLMLGTIVQAHSPTVPQGQVIESDPVAGTMIAAGAVINLTISDGLVDVPDVRNYSLTEARSKLNDSQLAITIATKDACTGTPQGTTVVDQSILPGTTQQGGSITLYVTCAP